MAVIVNRWIANHVLAFSNHGGNWTDGVSTVAPQTGNECYVLYAVTGTVTSGPSGYTLLQSGTQGGIHWYLYHKTAGASESSGLNIHTATSGSDNGVMMAVAMSVSPGGGGPPQAIVGTAQAATGVTATAPAVTAPTNGNCLAVTLIAGDTAGAVWPTPSGWTLIAGSSGSSGTARGVSAKKTATAGASTGDATSTLAASVDNVGVQLVFSDAAAPPPLTVVPPLQVGHHGTHNPPGIAGPPLRAGPAAGGQFSPQVQRGHRY